MNGDRKPDLLVANSACYTALCGQASVAVLVGNGDGTFQPALVTNTTALQMGQCTLADFDGDAKLDVACAGSYIGGDFLLFGNGDGTFQPSLPLGASGPAISTGDFDGDGRPDLAAGGATVLLNIRPPVTATTLLSSANPWYQNQPVTFTATVSGQGATPTGTVVFQISLNKPATVPLVNGQANYS
jgi:hypothetical protein